MRTGILDRMRAYFFADTQRTVLTALGLIWLLDGALQFQSFMYSNGFVQMLQGMISGQPGWVSDTVGWGARFASHDLTVWNTLFALTQVFIGVGILYRRTTKAALAGSFAWALIVWCFGEAFGMLFMDMAMPLTGAPGAVLVYAMIGLLVWPNGRPGGVLGIRGARTLWAVLWLVMAWLWLMAPSSSANAVHDAINAAPSGMSWLSTLQDWVAGGAKGNGLIIAFVLAAVSALIGIGVVADWHAKKLLAAAIVLNLAYWLLGQGFGGIFAGGATDPNAGPVFVLLAVAMFPLVGAGARLARTAGPSFISEPSFTPTA
jgi:hypothetical protein